MLLTIFISGLLRIIWGVKDLDWGLINDTVHVLFNSNLVFEALGVVCIKSVLVTISFDTFIIEAVEAHDLLPGPDTTEANGTIEILSRLEEERAIV